MSPMTSQQDRDELIFPMGKHKTRNLLYALATGSPLSIDQDACPVHAWPVPRHVTPEWHDNVLVVTFHPCGHRGYPDLTVPGPTRLLASPIARPPKPPRFPASCIARIKKHRRSL